MADWNFKYLPVLDNIDQKHMLAYYLKHEFQSVKLVQQNIICLFELVLVLYGPELTAQKKFSLI